MKILAIHVDNVRYSATEKTPMAEDPAILSDTMDDCVLLYCCVEKRDEGDPEMIVSCSRSSICERLGRLKVRNVMLYPYAHLANDLSRPRAALQILQQLEAALREEGLVVKRAPFGWYKKLEMVSKGHPMADFSMSICPWEGRECGVCPFCSHPLNRGTVPGAATSVAKGGADDYHKIV